MNSNMDPKMLILSYDSVHLALFSDYANDNLPFFYPYNAGDLITT